MYDSLLSRRTSLLQTALFVVLPAAAQETLELRLTVDRVDENLPVVVRLIGTGLDEIEPAVFPVPIPSRELRWYQEELWR